MSSAYLSCAPQTTTAPSALLVAPRYCGSSNGPRASNSICAHSTRGSSRYAGESDSICGDVIRARRSTSKGTRIDAKHFKGVVGDPWAPVHRTEAKSLTLSGGDFDYRRLYTLLFSGDWAVPPLARENASDPEQMLLVAEALARGNAKTEGFKSRVLPIPGRVARRMFSSPTATTLSRDQMQEIDGFDTALRTSLALVAARGDRELLNKRPLRLHQARACPLQSGSGPTVLS